MPISGKALYPFRWWHRASIDRCAPIQGDQIISTPFVTLVPAPPQPGGQVPVAPVPSVASAAKKK